MLTKLCKVGLRPAFKTITRNSSHSKRPSWYKDFTYNDHMIPQGSWSAYYKERNRKNNILMVFSTTLLCTSLYFYYLAHDFVVCPDEPAPRWYPLDRFAEGENGQPVEI